jgi:ADP-ribosyl-[dinitrogen reductase] hydrolase
MDYSLHLRVAIDAALAAGQQIRDEFHRPGGPRGSNGKAPVDTESEHTIRAALDAAFPGYGLIAEELPGLNRPAPSADGHLWLIDPNVGTSAFLRGWRGSAVSIGLLRDGKPVLGVVYAPLAPDSSGDLFAWAQGCGPVTRNGTPVPDRAAQPLSRYTVVAVSQDADRKSAANAEALAPARFLPVPGIAYRLALLAAGEVDAAVSLNSPGALDIAGGHALLAGAGLVLLAGGEPVTYTADGRLTRGGDCVGGPEEIAHALASRDLRAVLRAPADEPIEWPLETPRPGMAIADPGVLSRAQGCMLGQCAGDALGQLVEFETAANIARRYPDGVREMRDGGTHSTIAGQPTDDTELALLLARAILRDGAYDAETAARAYAWWMDSRPFDVGGTIRAALGPALGALKAGQSAAAAATANANAESQANGALMRVSPLAIHGWRAAPEVVAERAREDARLTHPHPVCQDANALIAVAVAHAIRTGDSPRQVYEFAAAWAARAGLHPDVQETLAAAIDPPECGGSKQGWVRVALQNALYELLHAESAEQGVVRTVMRGGDTDTNAAIAGALLGAVHGRKSIPAQWQTAVLTCRPLPQTEGIKRPRPKPLWPADAMHITELLLRE